MHSAAFQREIPATESKLMLPDQSPRENLEKKKLVSSTKHLSAWVHQHIF